MASPLRPLRETSFLLINQFFWPETAATSQFLTDVARSTGPETTVLCAPPTYSSTDAQYPPNVHIIHTNSKAFNRTRLGRAASYCTFLTGAIYKAATLPRPQVVLTLTTPPLASLIGTILKSRRHGPKHIIWEMDLYPDIATDLGYLKARSFTAQTVAKLADWSRRHADRIIVLGDDMKIRLMARGIPESKIRVAENWADGLEITPKPFPEGPLTINYSGNLGLAHDIATIAAAIRHFDGDPRFQFIFGGGGPQKNGIPAAKNVVFRPYVPRAELGDSLAEGHLGLVTQRSETCGSIVPSKTYGIMAAGRPILYIGPKQATPAKIIEKHDCGWQLDPGDAVGLIQLLTNLESNRPPIIEKGAKARAAFEKNYDKAQGVARILSILSEK